MDGSELVTVTSAAKQTRSPNFALWCPALYVLFSSLPSEHLETDYSSITEQ